MKALHNLTPTYLVSLIFSLDRPKGFANQTWITHLNSYCSFLPWYHGSNHSLGSKCLSLIPSVSVIWSCTTNHLNLNCLKQPFYLFMILWVSWVGFHWMSRLWLTCVVPPRHVYGCSTGMAGSLCHLSLLACSSSWAFPPCPISG